MFRTMRGAALPARFLMLARETFEASVAIHYDAPWARQVREPRSRTDAA